MKKMPKRAKKESTWGSGKLDQKQKHKEQSTRRSIVQILEQLRAMSESEMLGCNPDKKKSLVTNGHGDAHFTMLLDYCYVFNISQRRYYMFSTKHINRTQLVYLNNVF